MRGEFVKKEDEDNIRNFEVGRILAHGMIGIVYLARSKEFPKFLYCLKVMHWKRINEKRLFASIERELKILVELTGLPHIIPLLQMIKDDDKLTLVFPFASNNDLFKYKNQQDSQCLPEWEAQKVMKQLIVAL